MILARQTNFQFFATTSGSPSISKFGGEGDGVRPILNKQERYNNYFILYLLHVYIIEFEWVGMQHDASITQYAQISNYVSLKSHLNN